MKKFLSMVMALAMTLTLVTVGASAKDFTDKSTINYKEAVDVISTIGVVDGYTDGTFNPSATLTRGAAAKIICNLILGPTAANAMGVTSAPFKDVPVSNVFAGYIAYCSSQGIINGYSDGTFKPAATVTGFQFLKMLLGALGYDGSIEGFTGSNWAVNVAKLAISTSLTDGNDTFVGSKALTREEAALYALNTLKTPMVYYNNKGTEIKTSDGTTIRVGASAASPVLSAKNTISGTGDLEFGEQYFPKLSLDASQTDSMGRTANTWTFKGTKIGAYASQTAKLTYTATVKAADMATALKDYSLSSVVISKNGNAAAAASTTASAIAALTGDGVTVMIYTNNATVTKVVSIKNYIAKVTAVDKTAGENTYAIQNGTTTTSLKTETGYGAYAKDSYVVVTPVFNASNNIDTTKDPSDVYAATKVSGTVSYVKSDGTQATVDGTTYTMSATASTGSATAYTFTGLVKSTVTVYADANGYVLYGTQGTDVADYILVVKSWTTTDSYANNVTYVQGVLADGTIKVCPIVTDDKTVSTNAHGTSYTLISDGTATTNASNYIDASAASPALPATLLAYTMDGSKIKLTTPNGAYVDQVDTGSAYTTSDVKVTLADSGHAYYGSNVQFVLANKTGADAVASVASSVQSIAKNAIAYAVHTDDTNSSSTTATYVFVYGTTAVSASTMVFIGDPAVTGVNANGNEYTAYVDGVKTTITATGVSTANNFYTYSVDSKGVYTLSTTTSGVYTDQAVSGVYNSLLTAGTLADAKCANATVVDLTDNGITTMDGLKSLVDTGAAVKVSVVYNSSDKSCSYVYITSAAITAAASTGASTITITGMTLSKISSVEYKINGVTTVAAAADISTATGVVSHVTVASGATVKVTVTSIDGYKLVGTCTAGA